MEFRSHRPHHFFPFRAAEPSEGIGGELEIRDGTTVQSRRQVEVSQLLGRVFRHLSALPKGRHLLAELRHLQLRIAMQAWGRRTRGGPSWSGCPYGGKPFTRGALYKILGNREDTTLGLVVEPRRPLGS